MFIDWLPFRLPFLHAVMKMAIILCLTFSLFLNGGNVAFSHQPDHRSSLHWYEWGKEAFDRAQSEDKLILLDLTAVWCHACHVMDQTTYANLQVLALLEENFIAIRVDTDQRPDLEARYRSGGWPTTSVLMPTGEILFQANSLEPEMMVQLLQEIRELYDSEKEDLQQQAAQLREDMRRRPQLTQSQEGAFRPTLVSHSVAMMKNEFDPVNGGFRHHPKFFEPEAIQLALSYGFFEHDMELMNMALTTLEKQVALLDPIWGGFYRYAEYADWSQPHYEKMLGIQAQNLRNYVAAFHLTQNSEYKYVALRIIEYVETFLTDSLTGQFFESQDADVRDSSGITKVSGADYFSKGGIHRKARGYPQVDRKQYSGSNADMARAYLQASLVFGKPEWRDRALKVLKGIVVEHFDLKKGLSHRMNPGSLILRGMLADHIRLGLALVEAFQVTEDVQWLKDAKVLALVNQELLQDQRDGGFFDHVPSSDKLGLLKISSKPASENILAARLYLSLFHLTNDDRYRSIAEQTLQSVVSTPQPLPIALIGLAADEWFRPPVHIAVVGKPDDGRTQSLIEEGRRLYCPRKMVKAFIPGSGALKWGNITFPTHVVEKPAAYICTDQVCLAPVYQAEKMKEGVAELLTVLRDAVP